jgi:hypothetical protein
MGRSLRRENGSAVYNCCWVSPAQSFLGPNPAGLVTIFHSLRIKTPPTWRARSPYLYPPGTGWPSYTTRHRVPFSSPPTTRRATVEIFQPASTRDCPLTRLTESQSQSYFATGGLSPIRLGAEPLETHGQNFSQMNTCGHSPYITSSLTRGWVCHLQLLLALASAFILGSEFRGTCDHILLPQIRDFPFCRLPRLAGLRWRYSTPPPHGNWL